MAMQDNQSPQPGGQTTFRPSLLHSAILAGLGLLALGLDEFAKLMHHSIQRGEQMENDLHRWMGQRSNGDASAAHVEVGPDGED